jgi:hypothetical protein
MVFVSGSEYVQNLNRLFIIKKCSNSDGKQFHQNQQNKQSSLTEDKQTTTLEIVVRAWNRHKHAVGLNQL